MTEINESILSVLRGITHIGDFGRHSQAVGALIALGHPALAWKAQQNFQALEGRRIDFREHELAQWSTQEAAGKDPTVEIMDGNASANPHEALFLAAQAERREIVAEVERIFGKL